MEGAGPARLPAPRLVLQGPLWSSLRYLIVRCEGARLAGEVFLAMPAMGQRHAGPRRRRPGVACAGRRPHLAGSRGDARQTDFAPLLVDDAAYGAAGKTPVLSPTKPLLPLGLSGPGGLDAGLRPGTLIRRGLALAAVAAAWIAMRTCRMLWWRAGPHCEPPWDEFDERAAELIAQFARAFPGRADRLAKADLSPYRNMLPLWKRLLAHYDVVQAYATSPIWPLLAGKTPYVAFEHGTLRTFTLDDTPLCRTTALAYRMADHVFITNGDCVDYARKIGVTRMSPMLHPVNDRAVRAVAGAGRQAHDELHARWLFLCTLRHDWEIKGTDKYIRAIPAIRARIGDDFRVIMTEWGRQVEASKALADSLEVAHFLHWTAPLPRRRLLRLLKSVERALRSDRAARISAPRRPRAWRPACR